MPTAPSPRLPNLPEVPCAGRFQPHGAVIIVDADLSRVRQVSANLPRLLGVPAAGALEAPLAALVGQRPVRCLRRLLREGAQQRETVEVVLSLEGRRRRLHLVPHLLDERVLLEVLPVSEHGQRRLLRALNYWLKRLSLTDHPDALMDELAAGLRDLTGYARLLVCAFDLEGHGAVVAECREAAMSSLLGCRFPAGDQAPPLVDQAGHSALQCVPDIEARTVPLVPADDPDGLAPVRVPDGHLRLPTPAQRDFHRELGVSAFLAVPMRGDQGLWGLVIGHDTTPTVLSPTTKDAVLSLVRLASQQLHLLKARVAARFRQRVQDSRELLSAQMAALPSPDRLLAQHGATWCELFRAQGVALALPDAVCTHGLTPSSTELTRLIERLEAHGVQRVWQGHELRGKSLCAGLCLGSARGLLAAPLMVAGKRQGWLLLFRPPQVETHAWAGIPDTGWTPRRPAEPAVLAALFDAWAKAVAGHSEPWESVECLAAMDLAEDLSVVATAQQIQELYETLRRQQQALTEANERLAYQASHDPLTGAVNRYRIEQTLDAELAAAERYGRELSVLLLDVDHFKALNDHHGHEMGDRVLQAMTTMLQASQRATDVLGRWGGEEFVIVAGNTGRTDALRLAERLRGAIEALDIAGLAEGITASIGVASWRRGDTRKRLLARADAAMYAAKEAGRDRVLVEADEEMVDG